jgi:hypothetical protein
MPGLIDDEAIGLCETNTGLTWLFGGLGGGGLEPTPSGEMITETGIAMVSEASVIMITES